ncbi:carboxymuconolactone decarboxylase family protein [Marinomonas mediterranea]|uniref:Alkylhydroperoxidase like protein, AhpD family n=1 Tax=Marinomonas mediterranea (strain ATCC 700492 / JCM 21426 / NBRC 103028 / MMB-1) TaxID=717774 RepID=F2K0R2_MARM1|nr:carboxymuconolactone decarboxylase family protein [Marinomonas mediterranea]ADZ92154.1 alkylhydroperoxidase like protein, AhpD family [Marinomonas mediterranea MMB-1]WCN10118.1 carboxymuconolactone decarboxylase family protein [Marinomonas mediterranea]WCN14160.1 carboxymuconolactone decarboxylase family protein [Marinomonas mediterranea]WCN18216.1 carboxymuconolactone decarboxylase family protein [Marinomonas mediterranea MMB-1]
MKSYKDINQEQNALARQYRAASPDILNGFMTMHKAAMQDGALSPKIKEMMAVSIGIAARCDGCIASHVKAALRAGASREELLETINVAVMMGGGPSIIYGTQALGAVDEFLADD